MCTQKCISIASLLLCIVISKATNATFSIIACEEQTKSCGAAVVTNNLAVGASVIYAKAGVGALVSQYETNPNYGPQGLNMLEQDKSPKAVIEHLLEHDNNFDGTNTNDRQVAIVGLKKGVSSYTGKNALNSSWSGVIEGSFYSIQGNGLANKGILKAMEQAFLSAEGTLANQLMASLHAGQQEGGQTTGAMSSAMLVRSLDGFGRDINLRVDSAKQPIEELQTLLNFHYSRQMIIRAERSLKQDNRAKTMQMLDRALVLGATWDRIWIRAARLAIKLEEPDRAIYCLEMLRSLNMVWFQIEINKKHYSLLQGDERFQAFF